MGETFVSVVRLFCVFYVFFFFLVGFFFLPEQNLLMPQI